MFHIWIMNAEQGRKKHTRDSCTPYECNFSMFLLPLVPFSCSLAIIFFSLCVFTTVFVLVFARATGEQMKYESNSSLFRSIRLVNSLDFQWNPFSWFFFHICFALDFVCTFYKAFFSIRICLIYENVCVCGDIWFNNKNDKEKALFRKRNSIGLRGKQYLKVNSLGNIKCSRNSWSIFGIYTFNYRWYIAMNK